MKELVTDPEILRNAEPTEELLKAILQFKHMMKGDVLEAAREVVAAVVEQLAEKLKDDCRSALHGALDPEQRPPQRTFRNTDWRKTIRRNLKNWDGERERLVVDRIFFKHRQRSRSSWRIIVAVDQSGSMTDSLIHSSVMAAIFSSLPSVEVHLVLWDHRVMDVSQMADDPLEVLMTCQLGGGTNMLPAMQYCAGLITEPQKTIFVLLSDWYIFGEQQACLAMAQEMTEAGVRGIGLSALDADCRPIYDEKFARDLAGCGWLVAALTPKKLAEQVGKILA
jgi:Mg-chelatase subunit ChlD